MREKFILRKRAAAPRKEGKMKKRQPIGILAILLFVAVLFIPSYIAIAAYRNVENTPPDISAATKLTLSDINGVTYRFSEDDVDGKAVIDLFSGMISGATRTESLPVPTGTPCYLISFSVDDTEKLYQFYFSKTGDSYMVDKDAKVFRVPTEKVSRFLDTPYAAALYTASAAPSLLFNDTTAVLPQTIDWRYRVSKDSTMVRVDPAALKLASDIPAADSDGSFDLSFSLQPNRTLVTVVDDAGKELYNGAFINDALSKLSGELNIRESGTLTVTLQAEWNEASELDYSGNATYVFKVDFSAPAEFSLGSSSVTAGGLVVLNAKNAKHADRIVFSSSPALTANGKEIKPVFYSDGKSSVALVMIDYTTDAREYEFTVSYGAVTSTLKLTVEPRNYRTGYTSDVSAAIARQTHSETAVEAFNTLIRGLVSKTSGTPLFSGKFGLSVTGNPSYALGFGHSRTITSTGETYRNTVVDYYVAEGSDIVAAQDGVVLYCGVLDYPGNFVVIDHGLGLFTAYLHLGEYSVKAGDTVRRGDTIGTAGTSGFIAAKGANHSIAYFQDGNAFCGYELEEKGLPGVN